MDRGSSSAGRALHWQCKGQGFESPLLHRRDRGGSLQGCASTGSGDGRPVELGPFVIHGWFPLSVARRLYPLLACLAALSGAEARAATPPPGAPDVLVLVVSEGGPKDRISFTYRG